MAQMVYIIKKYVSLVYNQLKIRVVVFSSS